LRILGKTASYLTGHQIIDLSGELIVIGIRQAIETKRVKVSLAQFSRNLTLSEADDVPAAVGCAPGGAKPESPGEKLFAANVVAAMSNLTPNPLDPLAELPKVATAQVSLRAGRPTEVD
jgi:hypothetical protein